MSEVAFLVAGMSHKIPLVEEVDYIGVDAGALLCMKQNISMVYAIGDFDSISNQDYNKLSSCTNCIKLKPEKDDTDSEAAVVSALSKGYKKIILYGGLGGRIDHELVNIRLMSEKDYPLELWNEKNRIKVIKPGIYKVKKDFKYLSFLALNTSVITLSGVKYPLNKKTVTQKDLFTVSNEIIDEAVIEIHSGKMLMMECND